MGVQNCKLSVSESSESQRELSILVYYLLELLVKFQGGLNQNLNLD